MRSPKWLKFYPSDFWGDDCVASLSPEAACAYLALLTLAWQSKGRLREPFNALRRVGFEQATARALWEEIAEAVEWIEVEGGWTQPRLWEEWQEAERQRVKAAAMGRQGGLKSAATRANRSKGTVKPTLEPTLKPTLKPTGKRSGSGSGSGSSTGVENPPTPRRGKAAAPSVVEILDEFPDLASAPGVREAWIEWVEYRGAKKPEGLGKPISVRAARQQLRAASAERAPQKFVQSIRDSIRNDWQGLFEPHGKAQGRESGGGSRNGVVHDIPVEL